MTEPRSVAAIQAWLVAQLAERLGLEPDDIDVREPFTSFGLSSREAVVLSGDLEEWLGRKLSATLVYEYSTIEALARFLSDPPGMAASGFTVGAGREGSTEPIAIIGLGCRFPGARNSKALWRLLCDGVDAITEVPPDRWDLRAFYDPDPAAPGKMNTRWGGFLEQVDQFDARFFGISPREAARMDPQQRLLLEVAWEALEDAGQAPGRLAGSRTGIFVGISTSDYSRLQLSDPASIDAYAGTGNAFSIAANRLSYVFDLQGPSLAVDTACSSSLVAVHLACCSLQNGESTLALAGGVNLILSPAVTINFTKAGAMAPDGRCKVMDARADGYVRGEGAGLVVLKPLSRALADGDPIYAVIRGSAVNQDGRTNGLMAPSPQAQEAVLREAYRRAGVRPGQVQYVEAHGTGTLLGDPIEAKALGAVVAVGRPPGEPCAIGSIKTNIGHLEAAAGIAGLIKVALSLKHRVIPPSLHFKEPNPHIQFDALPIRVQQTLTPWPATDGTALAGVSSFGFGGTNAHVVLEEAPRAPEEPHCSDESAGPCEYLLPLSARSSEALRSLAVAYQDYLAPDPPEAQAHLNDICYTASVRRDHFDHRLALVARSREELRDHLQAFLQGQARLDVASGRRVAGSPHKLVFVFPGQGSQWVGMGRRLVEQEPAFREALERCDQTMRALGKWSVLEELLAGDTPSRLDHIDVVQPAIFAIQVALAALWRAWGVEPVAVVGHSMGEVAAAHVAGALSLEDAVRVICRRSLLLRRVSGQGAMAAVELPLGQAQAALAGYEDRLAIAVSNSPSSTVLSGDQAALAEVVQRLQQRDVFCRWVKVDVASHSPQMDPLQADLLLALAELQPQAPSIPFISTVAAAATNAVWCDATYWWRNLREPVHFARAVQELLATGHDRFLEISPHPILLPAIQQGLHHAGQEGLLLPSLRREEAERAVLLRSLGALYAAGYAVDWPKRYPAGGRCVRLPSHPFQRERCWLDTDAGPRAINGERPGELDGGSSSQPLLQPVAPGGQEVVTQRLDDWFYEIEWQPRPRANVSPARPIQGAQGRWLIFGDRGGFGKALARLLLARGERCVLVSPGTAYRRTYTRNDREYFEVDPARPEDMRNLLRSVRRGDEPPCRGVIHLWSLDAALPEQTTVASLQTARNLGCGSVLHLVQALDQVGGAESPRLWLVTRAAQPVGQTPTPLAVTQGPLWGLGRALAQEHPALWGGLLDLPPETSAREAAPLLWAEVWQPDGEDQLAFRHGQRYVARLVRHRPAARDARLRWRADGSYLITGGLGDLGLQVARWMVEQGARRVILLGRTALPPRARWNQVEPGTRQARQIAAIRELETMGASVHLASADVADEAQLSGFLDEFRHEGWPPIRGVVHAAGVVQPQTLLELDLAALEAVWRPKVVGSWLLHRLLADTPLDFFVLFSSIASLLGAFGQGLGNYAAANAFMDALAHHRQGEGRPGLSINWGPWADVGMAARDERMGRLARRGIASMAPRQGLEALAQLLSGASAQVAVMPTDWPLFRRSLPTASEAPFLDCLVKEPPDLSGPPTMAGRVTRLTRDTLLAGVPEDRPSLLQSYLTSHVARVLGMAMSQIDAHQSLNSLGLDSMMAVELKNRIEVDLKVAVPMARFLEGPSLAQIVAQVLDQMAAAPPSPSPTPPAHAPGNRPGETTHPLSHGQHVMWLQCQLTPESAAYSVPILAHLHASLDVEALRRALQVIVERHEVLRTTYVLRDGDPRQQVHEHMEVSFETHAASSWTEAELIHGLDEALHRPFDLEHGPLLRGHLFTRSPETHLLLLVMHHIAVDFWSLEILIEELRALYLAETAGTPAALSPLTAQYTDFVAWQADMLAGAEGERLWAYWQRRLAGKLPVLKLPTDRGRPSVRTSHSAIHFFKVEDTLVGRLRVLAASEQTTLFTTLLAAFQTLLYRYTSQDDLIVGVPMVGRARPDFAHVVGCCAEVVALRGDLSGNPPFSTFLGRVRRAMLEALAHQYYPLALLVERLKVPRDPSRLPLVQVAFSWDKPLRLEQSRARSGRSAGEDWLELETLPEASFGLQQRVAMFELLLIGLEASNSLSIAMQYNTDLFDEATIIRMAGHFRALLEGIVARPEQRISELPLLTEAERQQVLVTWNATQVPYPSDVCLHELFAMQAERTSEAVAVIHDDGQLTYGELNHRANRLAHQLRTLGVGPDVLVGLCVERSPAMMVGLLAVLKAGGAYVPLDPALPEARLRFMLEDSRAPVVVTQRHLAERFAGVPAALIEVDAQRPGVEEPHAGPPESGVSPDNLAYVIYTSGSTGTPKGVLVPHRAIVNHNLAMARWFGLNAADRVLQFHSLSFDAAVEEIFPTWLSGGTLVLRGAGVPSARDLLHLVERHQLTVLNLPTAYWHEWVDALPADAPVPPSLRLVIVGGERVAPARLAAWRQWAGPAVRWLNTYGPTEATIVATVWEPTVEATIDGEVPIGRPIANTQTYVLDAHREPVPVGVAGELYLGGAGVARGYLNRPELTAERFVPDPFSARPGARLYRTGDLARHLPDGTLEFLGRLDTQVKVRGFRIELSEIEAVLAQHPAVREAVVTIREESPGVSSLIAYVLPKPGPAFAVTELRSFLKQRLPEYMVPTSVTLLESLPLTANGKVDRQALPTPDATRLASKRVPVPPRGPVELKLTEMWEEVLGIRPIGVTDNFFDVGGHSLLAVRLMARIQREFGQELAISRLFQEPTIAHLAQALRQKSGPLPHTPLVEIQPGGAKRPFFFVHPSAGNVLCYYDLARHLGPDQPFYGLEATGVDGDLEPTTEVEAMAAHYVEALRVVQPEGPYLLGGWSMGGVVAFEMAHRIKSQGQEVAQVVLLDAWTAAAEKGRVEEAGFALLRSFVESLGLPPDRLGFSFSRFAQLGPDEQCAYILKRAQAANLIAADVGMTHVRRYFHVFQANVQAMRRYVPPSYAGRVTLLRAGESFSFLLEDPTMGWGAFAQGGVEIDTIPGNHYTMLREPQVQVLAERLRACLQQAPVYRSGGS